MKRIVEVLVGSTAPALVETDDGALLVLKFAGAGPGERGLLTEFIATRMARAFGAPAPQATPVFLPADFPWQVGTDEFDDVVRRSAGWNLGLRFVPSARIATPADLAVVDPALLARIVAADRFLHNVDRTMESPNILVDDAGRLHAIDHNACLYFDRALAGPPFTFALPAGHLLAGRALPEARLGAPSLAAVADAPQSWFDAASLRRGDLAERLAEYVAAFLRAQ